MENNDTNYCYYSGLASPTAFAQNQVLDISSSTIDIGRIIEMAWEDRTPFEAIASQFGLKEADVKSLMKSQLKFSSYKRWRARVEACKTKHLHKRMEGIDRFKCSLQRTITQNKISKR